MAQYTVESNTHINDNLDDKRHQLFLSSSTNQPYLTQLSHLLRYIVDHNVSKRVDVLRDLRKLLRKTGGSLPDCDRMQFFEAFYPLLNDVRWKIVYECTMLIVDIIPQMGEHDLDHCMAIILPRIIPNLGHESTDVRRSSLRALHVYMRYTNNLQNVLRLYVQYGLENKDKCAQKGCILSLPLLFTEEFSNENLFLLVSSLSSLLVNSDTNLFYPIFLALQRLHYLVGNSNFKSYLSHVNKEAVILYEKVLSRNSTANSANAAGTSGNGDYGVAKSETQKTNETLKSSAAKINDTDNNNAIPLEKLISGDVPKIECNNPINTDNIENTLHHHHHHHHHYHHNIDDENKALQQKNITHHHHHFIDNNNDIKLTSRINNTCRNLSKSKVIFDNEFILAYGIFPQSVYQRANSNKLDEKIEGINQMLSILHDISNNHIAILANYLSDFLENYVQTLIDHVNFKITLYGLEMIELIVERLKISAYSCIKIIIDLLFKRLGDPRSIVREHNIRVIHRLMLHFPPQNVLNLLLEQKSHRNPKIREEIINRVTVALLMFPRNEFNLCKLSQDISSMLIDPKRQVRLAALESIAVIAQALGPHRLTTLINIVENIERNSDADGLTNAVQARLSRRDLPKYNSDGTIRYVINPNTYSGWFSSPSDLDIEWVLMGSTSNIGTPPKLVSFNHHIPSFNQRKYSENGQSIQSLDSFQTCKSDHMDNSIADSDTKIINQIINNYPMGPVTNDHAKETNNQPPETASSDHSCNDDVKSESDKSGTSSKSRELWRYYLNRFKHHITRASCSSANSAISVRSKTADWIQKHEENENIRTFYSSNQDDYYDDGKWRDKHIDNELLVEKRHERALSMPTISSAQLSDISEKSAEEKSNLNPFTRDHLHYCQNKTSLLPKSVPTSPDRRTLMLLQSNEQNDKIQDTDKSNEQFNTFLEPPAPPHISFKENNKGNEIIQKSIDDEYQNQQQDQQDQQQLPLNLSEPTDIQILYVPQSPSHQQETHVIESIDNSNLMMDSIKNNIQQTEEEGEEEVIIIEGEAEDEPISDTNAIDNIKPIKNGRTEEVRDTLETTKQSRISSVKRKPMIPVRKRLSRSISPSRRSSVQPSPSQHQQHLLRIQPAIPPNANIRHIMENITKTEGPFDNPDDALKAAINALSQEAWTTKVEGMLAVTRLATFHPNSIQKDLHTVVLALVDEVKNLRSSVSRSAIFTLGDLFVKLKRQVEPEMELIGSSLINKSGENASFIREDVDKALYNMINEMPQIKSALILIHSGANHRNMNVRKTAAHFLSILVERMGPIKCLMGPKDIGEHLIQSGAKFLMDGSPHTRYFGRRIFNAILSHHSFDKMLRKYLTPGTYRNISGIIENIKRRGVGEKPSDLTSPIKE